MNEQSSSDRLKSKLDNQAADYVASAAKSVLGVVPFAGSLLVEIAGTIIPNQRLDRIAKFAVALDAKLATLDQEFVRSKLTDENFTDLMEEGMRQAARSLSDERRGYIAALIANGLSSEDIEFTESKHVLKILGEINDIEVIWLRSYWYGGEDDQKEYESKHAKVFAPMEGWGTTRDAIEKAQDKDSLRKNYLNHLCQLGLLDRKYRYTYGAETPVFNAAKKEFETGFELSRFGIVFLEQLGLIVRRSGKTP